MQKCFLFVYGGKKIMRVLIDLEQNTLDKVKKLGKKKHRSRKCMLETIIEDAVN